MTKEVHYGLEKARSHLPSIVAEAHAGKRSVITRHGKPCAAVVPVSDLEQPASKRQGGILALRGSGKGLWNKRSHSTVADLRDEWPDNEAGR